MLFYLCFNKLYLKMAQSLINSINKYHNFSNIIICSDEKDILSFFLSNNIEFIEFHNNGLHLVIGIP
jgi:hypothetical protein